MHNADLFLSDLPENSLVAVQRDDIKLVVIRSGLRVFAYEDKCPHAFWPLSQGIVEGSILECPGHGWEFDVQTGRCLTSPAYCLRAVPIKLEGERIVFDTEQKLDASCTKQTASFAHS